MFKIIGNIANIPVPDAIAENRATDYPTDDTFKDIKRRVRERALHYMTNGDLEKMNNAELVSSHSFERYPIDDAIIQRLGSLLGLHKPHGRMQTQAPGVMATMHVDDLEIGYIKPYEESLKRLDFTEEEIKRFYNNPNSVVRMLIPLEDSMPGQGMIFYDPDNKKSHPVIDWKAGDIILFDWMSMPHSTFNTSYWLRKLIRLTGFRTGVFESLANLENPFEMNYDHAK